VGANPQHFTLVANTPKVVTLDANYGVVEITNVDGAAVIYVSTDGTTNPTVAGDGFDVLPATINSVDLKDGSTGTSVVRLISAGTPFVSVRGLK
jgi:hypothetical protein